eukprot:gene6098-7379_t
METAVVVGFLKKLLLYFYKSTSWIFLIDYSLGNRQPGPKPTRHLRAGKMFSAIIAQCKIAVSRITSAQVFQSVLDPVANETCTPLFVIKQQEQKFLDDMLIYSSPAVLQVHTAVLQRLREHINCEEHKNTLKTLTGQERIDGWLRLHVMVWTRLWALVATCLILRIITMVHVSVMAASLHLQQRPTNLTDLTQDQLLNICIHFMDNGLKPLVVVIERVVHAEFGALSITQPFSQSDLHRHIQNMMNGLTSDHAIHELKGLALATLHNVAMSSTQHPQNNMFPTVDVIASAYFEKCFASIFAQTGSVASQELHVQFPENKPLQAVVSIVPHIARLSLSCKILETAHANTPVRTLCLVTFRSIISETQPRNER